MATHAAVNTRGHSRLAFALMVLPTIGWGVFQLNPMFRGVYLAFTDAGAIGEENTSLVGLNNFATVWADPVFWNAVRVTLQYVVLNIGSQTVIALALAVAIDRLTQRSWVRVVLLLPWLIPSVTAGLLAAWLFDPMMGLINPLIQHFGFEPQYFFNDENMAMPLQALVNTWRNMGYNAILMFAGIQMIPKYLYEAGAIDGAGEWRMFTRITLPLLRPVLTLVLIVNFIGAFQVFDTIAVTTKGGPYDSTRVLNWLIYQKVFIEGETAVGAAIAVLLLIFLSALSIIQLRMGRANESDIGA